MKLFIFIFALVLLHAMAMPIEDEANKADQAKLRNIAEKTAKVKKAMLDLQETIVEYNPEGLPKDLSSRPSKTLKSNGTPAGKRVNKKFLWDFLSGIFG